MTLVTMAHLNIKNDKVIGLSALLGVKADNETSFKKVTSKYEKEFQKTLIAYFNGQREEVMEIVKKAFDDVEVKGADNGFDPNQARDENGKWSEQGFNDWFKGSKIVDADGKPSTVYHQTSKEAAAAIEQEGFKINFGRARLSDPQVPDGVFFKPTTDDIGVGADDAVQIPVYLSIKNPLVVNTDDSGATFRNMMTEFDEQYGELDYEQWESDKRYSVIDDRLWKELKGLPRGEGRDPIRKALQDNINDWEKTNKERAAKMRERINIALEKEGYDGLILANDVGSFGRKTRTIVALSPKQIKLVSQVRKNKNVNDDYLVNLPTLIYMVNFIEQRKANKRLQELDKVKGADNGFDPNQARDENGMWTDGNAVVSANDVAIDNEEGEIDELNSAKGVLLASFGGSNEDAIENKRVSQEMLEELLKDNQDFVKFANYFVAEDKNVMKGDEVRATIYRLVNSWATTSGDNNEYALAIQLAVEKEFGIVDAFIPSRDGDSLFAYNAALGIYKKNEGGYRAFVRAQYDLTQRYLEEKEITELLVFRGVGDSGLQGISIEDQKRGGNDIDIKMQPISSFSLSSATAYRFTGSAMLSGVVPKERVFSTPKTGFGCTTEAEIVVLGGKTKLTSISVNNSGILPSPEDSFHNQDFDERDFFNGLREARKKSARKRDLINIDESLDDADWIKQAWDLPEYNSPKFYEFIKSSGMTLEQFKKLPVYKHLEKLNKNKNIGLGLFFKGPNNGFDPNQARDDHGQWISEGRINTGDWLTPEGLTTYKEGIITVGAIAKWREEVKKWEDNRPWIARAAIDNSDKFKTSVIVEKGELKGIASYIKETGNDGVDNIYVADIATKEKGYGTRLMQEVINEAAKYNMPIRLYSLSKAVRFYKKIGFVPEEGESVHIGYGIDMELSALKCRRLAQSRKALEDLTEFEPEDGCFSTSKYKKNEKGADNGFDPNQRRDENGRWTNDNVVEIEENYKFEYGTGKTHYAKFCESRDKLSTEMRAYLSDYGADYMIENGLKPYLSSNGKTGFAIGPDGDLCNLFSMEHKGADAIRAAIKLGAKKLDCFDGKLPEIYSKFGFEEYKREPNWTKGKPDVVYMRLKGAKKTVVLIKSDREEKRKEELREIAERMEHDGVTYEQADEAYLDMFDNSVKGVDGLQSKAKKPVKFDFSGWAYENEKWNKRLQKEGGDFIKEVYDKEGKRAWDGLSREIGGLSGVFDIDIPFVKKFIEKYSYKFAKEVNEYTVEMLRGAMTAGLEEGLSMGKIAELVSGVFDLCTETRALLIARTETIRASNGGAISAYIQSGVVEGKKWLLTDDDRLCPFCREMDNESRKLNENFYDLGDELTVVNPKNNKNITMVFDYEDVACPPLHPNCRCTIVPIIMEKYKVDLSKEIGLGAMLNKLKRGKTSEH